MCVINLIVTFINIQEKTKNGVNTRLNFHEMKIRYLTSIEDCKHTFLSNACYTLSIQEKINLREFLKSFKVPQGYSSNIKGLMSM